MTGFHLEHALVYGLIVALLAGGWIMLALRINPRIFLRNYPKAIREAAPPVTPSERRLQAFLALPLFMLIIGFPFWSGLSLINSQPVGQGALFLDAFIVAMVFNVVDLLVLDILWLGLFPPRWAMIPGTETVAYRPEFARHIRGFVVGTVVATVIALVVSLVVPALVGEATVRMAGIA